MKITKLRLKELIKEELNNFNEGKKSEKEEVRNCNLVSEAILVDADSLFFLSIFALVDLQ